LCGPADAWNSVARMQALASQSGGSAAQSSHDTASSDEAAGTASPDEVAGGDRGSWSRIRSSIGSLSLTNGMELLRRKSLEKAIGGSSADCAFWHQAGYTQPESFHELSCSTASGALFDFGCLKGKVVICVNVASL